MENTENCLYDARSLSQKLCMSLATINRRIKEDGNFPKPKRICGKNYWTNGQIDRYIQFIENDGYAN